jgi:hypothetical protein
MTCKIDLVEDEYLDPNYSICTTRRSALKALAHSVYTNQGV